MDWMFNIQYGELCDNIVDVVEMPEESAESIRDLILQFGYQQAFTVYMVCCDLAEAGMQSINC